MTCVRLVAQLCPTLCKPVVCSPLGSSVHGILQARILEWVAMPSSKGSSWPRDWTCVSSISCIGRQILYCCAIWEALINIEIFYCCRFFLWGGGDNREKVRENYNSTIERSLYNFSCYLILFADLKYHLHQIPDAAYFEVILLYSWFSSVDLYAPVPMLLFYFCISWIFSFIYNNFVIIFNLK